MFAIFKGESVEKVWASSLIEAVGKREPFQIVINGWKALVVKNAMNSLKEYFMASQKVALCRVAFWSALSPIYIAIVLYAHFSGVSVQEATKPEEETLILSFGGDRDAGW
jgi:quinol-cytochrome oxidoreductase complex cytochrome b subunit